jgi:hypothetical protein
MKAADPKFQSFTLVVAKQEGHRSHVWSDGKRFEGQFRAGLMDGRGSHVWPDGTRYDGEYREGLMHGAGCHIWADGTRYEGEYVRGRREGRGVHIWANGLRYEGLFKGGLRCDVGKLSWPDGRGAVAEVEDGVQLRLPNGHYQGQALEGKRHGRGLMRYDSGQVYERAFYFR